MSKKDTPVGYFSFGRNSEHAHISRLDTSNSGSDRTFESGSSTRRYAHRRNGLCQRSDGWAVELHHRDTGYDGAARGKDQVTLTFDAVPGNGLHDHVSGSTYTGDDYFGYSPKTKMYWSASADNQGTHGSATSTDAKTYSGTSSMGATSMSVTSTYARVSANNITLHEVVSGNGQQLVFDSNCTR
jgi:hypothetical protein